MRRDSRSSPVPVNALCFYPEPMNQTHKQVARSASSSPALRVLARTGYAANGVVHILIGAIALTIALGGGGSSDQSGAMKAIAGAPAGFVLLWILALGLFALALWYIIEGILEPGQGKDKWTDRLASFGRAAAYLFLGGIAVTFALGGSANSEQSTEDATAGILRMPGGAFIVGLGGLIVLGIGGYFVYKGVKKKFLENLSLPGGQVSNGITKLGVVGYIAKGIALGIIGILLIAAGVTSDSEKAAGFDGALKSLLDLPYGPWLLGAVGVGLIAYGVFQFARARYTRL